jgi:hypothetical protein
MELVYKIKNALRIPMVIAIILSIPVFYDVFNKGLAKQNKVIVVTLIFVFIIFAANSLFRKISIFKDRITILNILGKKIIPFNEISSLDGISLGRRQYISITHKKKTHLIPNSFNDFPNLLLTMKELVQDDIVGQGFKDIENFPLSRTGDTIAVWITVLLLAGILIMRVT